jgi:hypothetical protein
VWSKLDPLERPTQPDARIVDNDIDLAETALGLVEGCLYRARVSDIEAIRGSNVNCTRGQLLAREAGPRKERLLDAAARG